MFDVLTAGPLGGDYEFAEPELANDITQAFQTYQVDAIDRYEPFEVMRKINRECLVFSAIPTQLPYVFPAVWLLQNRIWEPMFAVIAAYALAIVVHPLLFALIYVLTCVYFGRGQVGILRSYGLFHEHTLWLCVAARSIEQAQAICRQIDPRCNFRFSHVGHRHRRKDKTKLPTSNLFRFRCGGSCRARRLTHCRQPGGCRQS